MNLFSRKKFKKPKGAILAFTLFTLVILATLGLGMLMVMVGSSKGSFAYQNNTQALDYATAGVERSISELETNLNWTGDSESIGNGTFKVSAAPPSVLNNGLFQWTVTSTGYSGGVSRTVTALITQESFARYGYYSNNENLPNQPNTEWWIGGNVVEGPMGTNGFYNIYGHPAFTESVVSSNGCFSGENCGPDPSYQDPYYNYSQSKYTSQNPPNPYNPEYFYHYFSSYKKDSPTAYNNSPNFSFAGGQTYLPWPTVNQTSMLPKANLILSDQSSTQLANQCNCSINSSNYIQTSAAGTQNDLLMTLNSDGTVTVQSGGQIVNQGKSQGNAGPLSYQCPANGCVTNTYTIPSTGGTIYVQDGNVMLSGSLKGALTIVTGSSSSPPSNCATLPAVDGEPPNCGNVDIEGNVTYNDKTVCTGSNNSSCNSYTGKDNLGIVATGDVNVDSYSAPTNVEVDGSIMALPQKIGNTTIHTGLGVLGYPYSCQNDGTGCDSNLCYTNNCPPAEGNYYLYGGMLPELGGEPIAIFNSGSGQITSGYNQILYYNPADAQNPPPNFPITGQFYVLKWLDSDALGE